jgi:hypothetical protein
MKLIIIAVISACLLGSCATQKGGHCDAYGKKENVNKSLITV